ncbi:MAG TPA: hypothetical protein VF006_17555 [Longimicrobium sp.]
MNGLSAGFDPARAQLLEQLAEIALQNLSQPVFLPPGWDVVQFVAGTRSGSVPSAQGFYAKGDLDGNGDEVAVLALGVGWKDYIDKTQSGGLLVLEAPPPGVVSGARAAKYELTLGSIYSRVRASIWQHLAQGLREGNGTLFVTGKGLGGPLAQLAALDLRPGNRGPAGEPPPEAVSSCFAFSTPPSANPDFKTYYDGIVTDSPVFRAGHADFPVDFFPLAPTAAQGWALPGTSISLDASLPAYDDPWQERGGNLYLRALGGTPTPPPVAPGRVRNPPAGFDRGVAFTYAQFCSIAYLAAQHPGTSSGINISPYQVVGDVTARGTPLCTLFASPDTVVAAFRGTTTWAEFQEMEGDTFLQLASFLPDNTAMVLGGALRTYTAPVSATDPRPFREALLARLAELAPGKGVYLAGHALGGALANLAAADVRSNASGLTLRKVYTYGANTLGSYSFAQFFAARLGPDSYQVARPGDFAPRTLLASGYEPLGAQVVLDGTPPDDDFTQHTLTGYIQLLDPRTVAPASARAKAKLDAGQRERFDAMVAEAGMAPEHVGAAPAPSGGALVLGGEVRTAAVHPRSGLAVHAFETLHVPAGAPLEVRAADGGPVHLVVGRISADAGAHLSLPSGTVDVMHVAATDELTLRFVGRDGVDGPAGSPGSDGAHGHGNAPGEAGGTGGHGRNGEHGMDVLDTVMNLGALDGGLVVYARGGNGGNAGPGGPGGAGGAAGAQGLQGGAGGPGGPGGNGGFGGNGGTITLNVRSVPPDSVRISTPPSQGGAEGAGGAGGRGGGGAQPGPPGPAGPAGRPGAPGAPSVVNVVVLER